MFNYIAFDPSIPQDRLAQAESALYLVNNIQTELLS